MTQVNVKQEVTSVVNGINMDVLLETVQAVSKQPELGKSVFRASNTWDGGSKNATTIGDFYAAGQENEHKHDYVCNADEPLMLAGHDDAANPVEYLLHSLAACVTTSMVAHAAVRGINIEALESQLEGDIDINGFLGLDPNVPKGYSDIRVTFKVKSDASPDVLRELAEFSPVYNTLRQGANIDIKVEGN